MHLYFVNVAHLKCNVHADALSFQRLYSYSVIQQKHLIDNDEKSQIFSIYGRGNLKEKSTFL